MGISVKNSNISNNGAHGIYIQGGSALNIENVTIAGNGGHGIYHDQAAGDLQALGLPENIDRKALATLLSELETPLARISAAAFLTRKEA
jgi:hypothetical protein